MGSELAVFPSAPDEGGAGSNSTIRSSVSPDASLLILELLELATDLLFDAPEIFGCAHDVRRQEDHQICLPAIVDRSPEQLPKKGNVPEARDFLLVGVRIIPE